MRMVTRITYKFLGFSGNEVSERIFLQDRIVSVFIYHRSKHRVEATIRLADPPFDIIFDGKSRSNRGAKALARKWLKKAGASLASEARKRL